MTTGYFAKLLYTLDIIDLISRNNCMQNSQITKNRTHIYTCFPVCPFTTLASYIFQHFGAHRCPQLGRDLAEMWRNKLLRRGSIGISGAESGFPKWVYVYEVTA